VLRVSLAASALLGAFSLAAPLALSGRTREPSERLAAARDGLRRARPAAAAWAARELADAERLFRQGERRYRVESARPLPWRDFGPVAAALWEAERAAWTAAAVAAERRETARADAEDALADAEDLLANAHELCAHTALPARSLRGIAEARMAVEEARLRFEDAAYERARLDADRAREALFASLGGVLEVARRYTSEEQLQTWRRWIDQTRQWSLRSGRPAVLVYKEQQRLVLLERGEPLREYAADVGAEGLGRKLRQGDRATPEGRYRVVGRKGFGRSRFHKALLLDYPNAEDRRRTDEARRDGRLPPHTEPGGLIEIHGEGGRGRNWTDGCVALANPDMDELFERVGVGSWVTIVGSDGRDGAFSRLLDCFGPGQGR
jgi:hypothetical protein